MREMLFRGKTYDGKWEQGDLRHGGYVHNDSETYIMRSDYALHNIPVDPKTVGQYTGLTDKNGKKIFEGDVVKHYNRIYMGEPDFYTVVLIEWDGEKYRYRQRKNTGECYAVANNCVFEIIGNIHDNPELLNKEACDAK